MEKVKKMLKKKMKKKQIETCGFKRAGEENQTETSGSSNKDGIATLKTS